MSVYLYSVGQAVELVHGPFDSNIPRGAYTVTRQLPGSAQGREYRLRHQKDGHERVVLETRLQGLEPGVFG